MKVTPEVRVTDKEYCQAKGISQQLEVVSTDVAGADHLKPQENTISSHRITEP